MTKYLLNRVLRGLLSVVIVVAVVMILIYSCLDKNLIFAQDGVYSKMMSNAKETYKMQQWEKYGYLDYVPYADWLKIQLSEGTLSNEDYENAVKLGDKASEDNKTADKYVTEFTKYYKSKGYDVQRLPAQKLGNKYKDGGKPALYASRNIPVTTRLWKYFTGIIKVDNIHYVEDEAVGERKLSFTLKDPAYGGEKFSPAIMGNGTRHKYLLYFNSQFPYIHQNLVKIQLGSSFTIKKDVDVFNIMTDAQGSFQKSVVSFPSGLVEESAYDLHTATYVPDSLENGTLVIKERFVDNYTGVDTAKDGFSKMGYSFLIGILSVLLAYMLAIPLGTVMALKKDKLVDKLGTIYIVFIMAVPSLAYIFLFKAIGTSKAIGLPGLFNTVEPSWQMYVLPIISLALPSIANLMKWLRRYMIDQMNSDYVKFARSGGLSEGEIFSKHVLKNAIIPIVHGIPGSILGAMVGAIITERVYTVPGTGNLLTEAIGKYDNGVIVGLTLFYALLSIISIIVGDLLMSMVDPRISFVSKGRK